MIEGMQLTAMYPLLQVDAPANLGMLQAVLRKISTFELVDDDWLKENLWNFDLEEEIDYYLQAAGIDSVYFQFTLGFPLYVFFTCILCALILPLINLCIRTDCDYNPAISELNDMEGGADENTIPVVPQKKTCKEKFKEIVKAKCKCDCQAA